MNERREFPQVYIDQLPEGMQHCTIWFIECPAGHGRLTALNWVDHGCLVCARDRAKQEEQIARKLRVAESARALVAESRIEDALHELQQAGPWVEIVDNAVKALRGT